MGKVRQSRRHGKGRIGGVSKDESMKRERKVLL